MGSRCVTKRESVGAIPGPRVAPGIEVVPVEQSGVLVELVDAVEDGEVLEVLFPAPVIAAVAVDAVLVAVDLVHVFSMEGKEL